MIGFLERENSRESFLKGYLGKSRLSRDEEHRSHLCKGIEFLYIANYFGARYKDKKMLNEYILKLEEWTKQKL